ncbi:extracellular matrix protein 1 [Hemicordylus capensis]|uniref:extracellular matrix protein 1 n=1 Tax=Hemicordylus capensis TaxID=884348 RepID=UPI002303B2B8|nr:extracellular matrix protein 1 [Hemicordylus capensis]XP_053133352.1 extracellular matrix protein 1 [Hemicordylus capensis]XP_053133354.1 extracellular matrix protein 1 [Hemicordylus capensis]XP_053133355.1 extracellular matrix protein 1 [Hemicordylus capensis]XP_053133356.1 extracellular matrix protein 1 [Hemicordylus capensis]
MSLPRFPLQKYNITLAAVGGFYKELGATSSTSREPEEEGREPPDSSGVLKAIDCSAAQITMRTILVLLASWLVLAQSTAVATTADEGERPPPPSDAILQQDITDLQQREVEAHGEEPSEGFVLQREITDDVASSFLVHGEPQASSCTPTGRGFGRRSKLDEFPPGRPTASNLCNICSEGRSKASYGSWNLPLTGFSHLRRQGEALNNLEAGFKQCCQLPEKEKLSCCISVWSDVLEQFCNAEFSVKTRPQPCCKLEGASREDCFVREAPSPNYSAGQGPEEGKAFLPAPLLSPQQLPEISFPPGQPTRTNIKNICTLRRFRPTYLSGVLPRSGNTWFVRRAQTVNRVEKAFKKCCPKQDVSCARQGWQKSLTQFCKQERMVKDRVHACCQGGKVDYACFASQAPHPAYDKEIQVVSLAQATPPLLDLLCGQFMLLTKQRQIPALVKNITEPCCKLQGDERTQCAESASSQFITTLCSAPKGSWKDPKKCCAQPEGAPRQECFNRNYLADISVASAAR